MTVLEDEPFVSVPLNQYVLTYLTALVLQVDSLQLVKGKPKKSEPNKLSVCKEDILHKLKHLLTHQKTSAPSHILDTYFPNFCFAHTNIQCPGDRHTKLKIYISEQILETYYEYTSVAYITMHCMT
jgi:hypothetical protein